LERRTRLEDAIVGLRASPYRQAMSMTRDEFNIVATIWPVEVIDL
jgi:hypothetical protein